MISKFRYFRRNIDRLEDTAKNDFISKKQFFKVILKYRNFPRNIDSLEDRAKKTIFRQKSAFSS